MAAPQPCPACGRDDVTRALDNMSQLPKVKYYRCEGCGHVWVKFPNGTIHHVTPLVNVKHAS